MTFVPQQNVTRLRGDFNDSNGVKSGSSGKNTWNRSQLSSNTKKFIPCVVLSPQAIIHWHGSGPRQTKRQTIQNRMHPNRISHCPWPRRKWMISWLIDFSSSKCNVTEQSRCVVCPFQGFKKPFQKESAPLSVFEWKYSSLVNENAKTKPSLLSCSWTASKGFSLAFLLSLWSQTHANLLHVKLVQREPWILQCCVSLQRLKKLRKYSVWLATSFTPHPVFHCTKEPSQLRFGKHRQFCGHRSSERRSKKKHCHAGKLNLPLKQASFVQFPHTVSSRSAATDWLLPVLWTK